MQWRKTEKQYEILRIAEKCALEACRLDEDYYSSHRTARRSEIITIKRIASHIASDRMWVCHKVIGDFFNKNRVTGYYYVKTCQDYLEVDKFFAQVYNEARDKFNEIIAKMPDNY